jgi:hypothetical protein
MNHYFVVLDRSFGVRELSPQLTEMQEPGVGAVLEPTYTGVHRLQPE